jgi:hypothetical protein
MVAILKPSEADKARRDIKDVAKSLMPMGVADIGALRAYQPIRVLLTKENERGLEIALQGLIVDFCSSYNVVRPMNEYQIADCAELLLQDLGEFNDFTFEDYVLMFQMAKMEKFDDIKIMDRLDTGTIMKIRKCYEKWRTGEVKKEKEHREQSIRRAERERPKVYATPEQVSELVAEAHRVIAEGAEIRNKENTSRIAALAKENGYKEQQYLDEREHFLHTNNTENETSIHSR